MKTGLILNFITNVANLMVDNIKLNRYLASYSFRHESDVTIA
jgi:hypothetical protein